MEKTIAELDLMVREYQEDIKYHPKETLSKVWAKRIPKLLSTIEILKRVEDKAALYGKLFDLVNITEHLRGYERIEKIRKYTTAILNYLRGK